MNVFRTKSVEQSMRDTEEPGHRLRRRLGPLDLTVFGVGVIVGTGIFVLTGVAAGTEAGPAISLSFVFSGIACALAALCYAEFASTVPVAGSAYTFSYATLGEIIAWIIGWDLILELALGGSTVAVGWSQYLATVLKDFHIAVPSSIIGDSPTVNVGAAAIVLILTGVLCLGVKLSSRVNFVIVAIKLGIVLFVIIAGAFYVKTRLWHPFIPPSGSKPAPGGAESNTTPLIQTLFGYKAGAFGWSGIFSGAALVFFAYIGFDIVATAAEETKKPQRDLPIGILASLAICTVLYVAVSLVVTGMVPYNKISTAAPLAEAFRAVGHPNFATVVAIGALAGLTTVMLILMLGQSRIFFAMSRDRLLPSGFSRVSERYGTPYLSTIITGVVVAAIAAFVPLTSLAELVNIGTLFAFVVVSVGVVVLRHTHPDLPRAFRTPLVPLVPILSVAACIWLMLNLPDQTWIRFAVWMAIGLVIYALYGVRRSRVGNGDGAYPADRSKPGLRPGVRPAPARGGAARRR